MNQYLAIIRKADFVDLFKYGHLYVHNPVAFRGVVERYDSRLFRVLTSCINSFEYSFEYLMIHFSSEVCPNTGVMDVDIRDVQVIYAFDEVAKREISGSFDPRIQIQVSPWAKWFKKLQQDMFVAQSYKGVDNLWRIFKLPIEDKEKCRKIVSDDIIDEVFRELLEDKRPCGDQSLWVYLLRYERHSYYPQGMKGFFCDFIHVVCNWRKKMELDGEVAEDTEAYKELQGGKFENLMGSIANSNLTGLTKDATRCDFYIVAPLFLFLKSIFLEGMDSKKPINGKPFDEFIAYSKGFGFSFSLVTYLLGITLGYDKTYDCLYDVEKLKIFKKNERKEENTKEKDLASDNASTSSAESVSSNDPQEKEVKSKGEEVSGADAVQEKKSSITSASTISEGDLFNNNNEEEIQTHADSVKNNYRGGRKKGKSGSMSTKTMANGSSQENQK